MKKFITIAFFLISLSSFSQERVFFDESKISIIPPKGFQEVDFFKGFFNYSNGASIQLEPVQEVAYVLIAQGITKEVLQPQGATLIKKENITLPNGKKGILITMGFEVTQKNDGTDEDETRKYERIMYLTGDMNKTIFITVNYPLLVKDLVYQTIKESLFTAKFEN